MLNFATALEAFLPVKALELLFTDILNEDDILLGNIYTSSGCPKVLKCLYTYVAYQIPQIE